MPIRIEHAEVTTVTFTGVGYDRRILGDAKPAETGLVIPAKKMSVPADKNKVDTVHLVKLPMWFMCVCQKLFLAINNKSYNLNFAVFFGFGF